MCQPQKQFIKLFHQPKLQTQLIAANFALGVTEIFALEFAAFPTNEQLTMRGASMG